MNDRNAAVLTYLNEDELRTLSAQGVVKNFPRNTVIVSEGDETDSLYIIIAGRVKVFVSDEEGKEIVLGTQGPGEYFGEMVLDGRPRSASVMTLEPSRFAVIPKNKFRDFLLSHPGFSLHLIEKLIRRTRALTESVKSLALMDVYGRVARLLLELGHDEGGRLVIDEKLTQQDIASRVGASREMISRILKDLSTGGYITIEHKRITINKTPPRRW
ncbi:MAG: Crp/Fnr family transcriptional regulator [Betaproteobacteria bacterium RIFCSPLOWO2_12_FULL_62_58]|nr:MAG: Crp/Fnr family transcriptional regulator [Betaproteobacteria bacterium RIFCSPLOWO2_12_FULL_62_58]